MGLKQYQDIDETVRHYFRLLKKYKPLKKDEEQMLLRRYKKYNDIEARNRVIVSNLKYTCSIANQYRGTGIPFSDLISEANNGLIAAIDKYDFSRNVKLITYARWWVQQKIQIAVNKHKQMPTDELPLDNESLDGATDERSGVDYSLFLYDSDFVDDLDNDSTAQELLGCLDEKDRDIQ